MNTDFLQVYEPKAQTLAAQGVADLCDKESMPFSGSSAQALEEIFRCPESFFRLTVNEKLSTSPGYFDFGGDATCFGRCAAKTSSSPRELPDLFGLASVNDDGVKLPFDPNEVIQNLRLERYADYHRPTNWFYKLQKSLYYYLRPLTTASVRSSVQRFRARNWKEQKFPRWPVDTTVENLSQRLLLMSLEARGVDRVPFIWFWPDGARGCVVMTHDVETEQGNRACAELMDIDDSHGIKASFQVVPEGRYKVSPSFVDLARTRGFEIGIQDLNHDGRLYDNRDEFLRRAAKINQYGSQYNARGFRSAVLYRNPEWFHALEFSFDMSIPNVAHLDPQPGGCCTVMPYFIGDVLELPVTTTQDYMLFHILEERSIELWKTQIDIILSKNGMAHFIVHPDYVMAEEFKPLYRELLGHLREHCTSNSVWMGLPTEVDYWWRSRSQMSLVRQGSSWRIEGPEADRAVLAYAKNVDGRLTYELATTRGASTVL